MRGGGDTVDLAIVGNGAVGCALALRLAEEQPSARIALVGPSRRPGSASLAAAAMLGAFAEIDATTAGGQAARAKLELAIAAARRWPEHVEVLNRRIEGTELAPIAIALGTTVLCRARSGSLGAASFDAIGRALTEHGEPFEAIDPAELPGVAGSGGARALRIPGEGRVDAPALLHAYDAALSRAPNVDVVDAEVEQLGIDADGATKRLRSAIFGARELRARTVVIAAGVRSQALLDQLELGARIPRLVAGVGVALVLRAPWRSRDVLRCIADEPIGGPYVVPLASDLLYVGATNDVMEIGTTSPPPEATAKLLEGVTRYVHPRLGEARVERTLVGWRPTTLDTYPLLGPTSVPGVWLASGTKRDGFHLSPLIAAELARCIASSSSIVPFAGRFAPERPLLLELPKAIAVERTIAQALRTGTVEREAALHDVLSVYDRVGLSDVGIPPELFEMYRRGLADANVARYPSDGRRAKSDARQPM